MSSKPPPQGPARAVPASLPPVRSALLRTPRGRPRPLLQIRRWLRILGPGLVTGAADDDPSGIGTYSQAGAAFGTGQLWLAFYMLPLLIAVQEMCARIGLVTGTGIATVVRQQYSRRVLVAAVGLVFVANILNIGADLGAMTATIQLLVPGLPFLLLLVPLALGILALEVFIPYRRYAVVLKVLALALLAYVATGLIIGPQGAALLRATVVPTIQLSPTFLALVVGVLGTTISPYLFFWQASEEVEEVELHHREPRGEDFVRQRQLLLARIRDLRLDTILGMLSSEVATWFIIFTTGSVLHTHGITTITTADQAAAALEPLVHTFPHAGVLAKVIFAVGILGVGLLGIPVLAGSAAYAVAEAFHWKEGLAKTFMQAPGFYVVIGTATLVGMTLNLLRINPIAALVYAAIINGVV
ncbi:MAG TPA: divalent metal cation transporter, partial [Ktedonobacterales bacterium]|nr:divalent metal cation transporter [Ktedonobacterales bacterium]